MQYSGRILSRRNPVWTIVFNVDRYARFVFSDVLNFAGRIKVGYTVKFDLTHAEPQALTGDPLDPLDPRNMARATNVWVEYPPQTRQRYLVLDPKLGVNAATRWEIEDFEEQELKEQELKEQRKAESEGRQLALEHTDDLARVRTWDHAVALALFDNRIKLVELHRDGEFEFLDKALNRHGIVYPSFIKDDPLKEAIQELEALINSGATAEKHFQGFFARNPDFLINDDYRRAHSHLILSQDESDILIPDFVLEPVLQDRFCDLLELKLPKDPVYILKKNRNRFSAAVSEAAAQLRTYRNFFEQKPNRERFELKYPDLKIYRPRMLVIIGRRSPGSPLIKQQVRTDHPELFLHTYDEILERAQFRQEKNRR